jgi:hypothetical protein
LFLDSLVILGAKPPNLQAGDYGYFSFSVDGSSDLHFSLDAPGKTFLYQFDRDTCVLRDLVKRFAKRYLDSINLVLLGGRGEDYSTAVLRWEQ